MTGVDWSYELARAALIVGLIAFGLYLALEARDAIIRAHRRREPRP